MRVACAAPRCFRTLAMLLGFGALVACGPRDERGRVDLDATAFLSSERGAALGPDDTRIGGIRVVLETGVANGAGTTRPVLLWLNNRRFALGTPEEALDPGERSTTVLGGAGLPRTLGELRRSSLVLALELGDAAIGASWYCARAAVEVRLEGSEEYRRYLDRPEVGWLSMGEPPRKSPLYALQ